MHKIEFLVIFLVILSFFFISQISRLRITGFNVVGMNVSIKEKVDGRILLAYSPLINITDIQQIYVEFENTGTEDVVMKMEIKVYGYENGTLKPLAYYYDAPAIVKIGMRKGFSTSFIPSDTGIYYIQAKAEFDTKVTETWGAFQVVYPTIIVPVYNITYELVPPAPSPPSKPAPVPLIANMSISYPKKVNLTQGEKTLFTINVNNTGEKTLTKIKLLFSTTTLLDFEINPKMIQKLLPNSSSFFLITIKSSSNTNPGIYPFEFEVVTNETSAKGKISIEVLKKPISKEDMLRKKILNYEFLISEVETQIFSAKLQGYNTEKPEQYLNQARESFEKAKEYFENKDFDNAEIELNKVSDYLEKALLEVSSLTLYVYKPPAYIRYAWIIMIIVVFVLIAAFVYYYRKKRLRRPRLLTRMAERGI